MGVKRVARDGLSSIVVDLANPSNWNDALTVAAEFSSFDVRDRDEKAGRFTLAMRDRAVAQLRDDAVRQGVETIRNRVDQFGVAEPTITRQGTDRILIQLPGVQDPERAKALIGKTALLEFRLLDEQTSAEQAQAGRLPEGSEILYQRRIDKETKAERKMPYVVQKRTLLTGSELTRAEVQADPNSPGNWQVAIEFTATGTRIFGEVTEQNVGQAPGHHPGRHAVLGAADQRAHSRGPRGHHRSVRRRGGARPRHRAAGRCAAGAGHDPGRAHRRSLSRRRLDPPGHDRHRRLGRAPSSCSC